jgi:hypothetical protein
MSGSKIQAEHQVGRKGIAKDSDTFVPSRCSTTVRKTSSVRPIESAECCTFCFTIFCSAAHDSSYGKWYISCYGVQDAKRTRNMHSNHLPVQEAHLFMPLSSLSETVLNDIRHQLQSGTPSSTIINKIRLSYDMTISAHQINKVRQDIINDLLTMIGENPSFSAADRLIQTSSVRKM